MGAPACTVHQFWYRLQGASRELPPLPRASQLSFVRRSGCRVWLWTYQGLRPADPGVVVRDAEELLPLREFKRHLDRGVNIAHLADWLRWLALHEHGGWWADMDAVCLRALPAAARVFQTIPLKRESGIAYKRTFYSDPALGRPHNSVFKVPPRDPLMHHMAEYTAALIRGLPLGGLRGGSAWDTIIFEFGDAQVRLGYEKHVVPPVLLAPLYDGERPHEHSRSWYGSTLPGLADIRESSYVVDFWGRRFKERGLVGAVLHAIDPALDELTGYVPRPRDPTGPSTDPLKPLFARGRRQRRVLVVD